MKNFKLRLAVLCLALAPLSAFAQDGLLASVEAQVATATTSLNGIISAITPICFIAVVAIVGIGVGLKLFRKAG